MTYDLSDDLQREQFKLRSSKLMDKGCIVELRERKPVRTRSQNSYLHVILGYFATRTGGTLEYVKENYYKKLVNPDIFMRETDDKYLGHIRVLRSSASLTTDEMATSIERFRNWAAEEAGVYIPSAEEGRLVQLMEIENERYKNYI